MGVVAPTEELSSWERCRQVWGTVGDGREMPATEASARSWMAALPLGWTGSGTLKVSCASRGISGCRSVDKPADTSTAPAATATPALRTRAGERQVATDAAAAAGKSNGDRTTENS